MKTQRIARFTIQRQYFDQWERLLLPLMNGLVILDAKMRWDLDSVEYMAFSNRFSEVAIDVGAPEWRVEPEFIDTGTSSGIVRLHLVGPDENSADVIAEFHAKQRAEINRQIDNVGENSLPLKITVTKITECGNLKVEKTCSVDGHFDDSPLESKVRMLFNALSTTESEEMLIQSNQSIAG